VIYRKRPLEIVICQLRFPAILRISSEPPAQFQDGLRQKYPLYREIPPIDVGTGFPAELLSMVEKLLPNPGFKSYEFSTEDRNWQVRLTQESLALSCKDYTRWEEFRGSLEVGLRLLTEIYQPSFFTRIGLRYRNVIARESLDLSNVPWNQLLSRDLAGELHSRVSEAIESVAHNVVIRFPGDAAKVTLQHGLGTKDDKPVYIIDNDLYLNQNVGARDAGTILEYFNRQAGRIFRWCITDRLHQAMEPMQSH
jgi:uncharacterized protein (TIGR04255 family)